MPKSIYEAALDLAETIKSDGGAAGAQNAMLAVAAMTGGIRSAAWRSYMMQFVEQNPPGQPVDPAQLERLLATDGTLGDPNLDRGRAYLVSNAICGASTEFTTTGGVFGIDITLANPGPAAPAPTKAGICAAGVWQPGNPRGKRAQQKALGARK